MDTLRATLKGHARCLGPSPDTDRPDAGGNNRRIAVLSLVPNDLDPAEAGLLLSEAGIHVRAGYHCAPWVHEHLGT